MQRKLQNNYWSYSSAPGIPTVYALDASLAIRPLWALEELVWSGKLQSYNVKCYSRATKTPQEMKDIFHLGRSPIMTVAPASAPDDPPVVFVESRLVCQFLADHYSDGIWEPSTPEDKARDIYFQEFACNTLTLAFDMVIAVDAVPQFIPWPFKAIFILFLLVARFYKKRNLVYMELMEDSLSDEKPWFSGAKMGLADFCMSFPVDMGLHRGYFDPAQYPKVMKWHRMVTALPTYQRATMQMGSYNLKTFGF